MENRLEENNMNFIKKNDLDNFTHLQIPRTIWELFLKKKIDQSTFKIYIELFDRLKISAFNNWIDDNGNVFIKYSYDELKEILRAKSDGTIANSLKQLKELNLVIQVKGFNTSSIFYLTNILQKEVRTKIQEKLKEPSKSDSSSKSCSTAKNCSTVLQKTEDQSSKKLEANHNNYNHNNYNNKIMNHEEHDFFENIFKILNIKFTTKNQKSVVKLLKKQTKEEIKNYLVETYENLKNSPDIKNISGAFTTKISKGERQSIPTTKELPIVEEDNQSESKTKNTGLDKAIAHIENNRSIQNDLEKEKSEKEKLDLFFNSFSTKRQNEIMEEAKTLAKNENNAPEKIIIITANKKYKYEVLRDLYKKQMGVI